MPFPRFINLTLDAKTNTIEAEGTTGAIDEDPLVDMVTDFDVAVIALDDPDRRVEAGLHAADADKLIDPWTCVCDNVIAGHESFAVGDVVIVVGSATHTSDALKSPFLWHGFYRVKAAGDPMPNEVVLVAQTAADPHP